MHTGHPPIFSSSLRALLLILTTAPLAGQTPRLVHDIRPNGSSSPGRCIDHWGSVFFFADDGTTGSEPWRTDGSTAGTTRVADIQPGIVGSGTSGTLNIGLLGSRIVFEADDGSRGDEPWISDGTTAGTTLLHNLNGASGGRADGNPQWFTPLGQLALFTATDGSVGGGLWSTDGTSPGTVRLAAVTATSLHRALDRVFFAGTTAAAGSELWTSDGTPGGTALLKDITPGSASSVPVGFVGFGGSVLFSAAEATSGRELWISDGTNAGTTLLADIRPGAASGSPGNLFAARSLGCVLFFADDGVHGSELWRTDGTPQGTALLADLDPGPNGSLPRYFEELDGCVVFVGGDAAHGPEPWVTDGTATGTFRLADLNPGPAGSVSAPSWLSTGRRAYFPADDGTHGLELWTTDGTSAGTRMVVDLRRGATGTQPRELVLSNGKVYFTADHPLFERELLVIDDPGATSKTVGVPSRSAWAHRFSAGNPVIGDRLVLHLRDSAPGAAIVVLFSSGVPRPIPFGAAGWLYVDPASFLVLAVGTTDARGSWSTSFPLDASLFLLQGLTTTMQALVGPSSAPLGFDLSNGAQATFGY